MIQNHNNKKLDDVIIHTKNSMGFRGEEPPKDFDRYLTLVTVGGSTTECFNQSDGKTWTDALGRHLKGYFDNVWINNAGLDGHSTFGHTILLEDYLSKIRPKVVIFQVGGNDRGLETLGDFDRGNVKAGIEFTSFKGFIRTMKNYSEVVNVLSNKYLTLRARWKGVQHANIDFSTLGNADTSEAKSTETLGRHRARFIEPYRKRLDALIRLTRKKGMVPVLITHTGYYGYGIDSTTGKDVSRINVNGLSGGLVWDVLDLYNNVTRDIAATDNVPLIDLDRKMPKDSRYYYDFEHLTNEGAELVGRIISEDLKGHLERFFPEYSRRQTSGTPR